MESEEVLTRKSFMYRLNRILTFLMINKIFAGASTTFVCIFYFFNTTGYAQLTDGLSEKRRAEVNMYSICKKEMTHAKLYDFGGKLAEGWALWLKSPKTNEIKSPTKTRKSFMLRSFIGFTERYNITDNNDKAVLYMCWMGYLDTADQKPWSSVHQGLFDYLSPSGKSKFMSLPER